MLKKIVINRFRSCVDLTIDDIGPTMVLVGRNGAGKTNILRAILWAAETAMRAEPVEWFLNEEPDSVSLEFDLSGLIFKYSIQMYSDKDRFENEGLPFSSWLSESVAVAEASGQWRKIASRNRADVHLAGRKPLTIAPFSPFLPFLFAYLPPEDPTISELRPVKDFLSRIRYYPFDEANETREKGSVIFEADYKAWQARFDATGWAGDSVIMRLIYMSVESPEDFEEVKSLLHILGVAGDIVIFNQSFSSSKGSGVERFYFASFFPSDQTSGPKKSFSFPDLSLGTRRIIRIVVSMIFDKSSVMMIEHPEDGIHRGLAGEVFGLLRGYADPCQVIISSHSTTVFDLLSPEDVRLIDMEDGRTRARALTPREIEWARKYINEQGSFSDYLKLQHDV